MASPRLVIDDEPQTPAGAADQPQPRLRGEIPLYGAAVAPAAEHQPDGIILDLGLPDMDGIEVLSVCAAGSSAGHRAFRAHRLWGQGRALDAGADDYVTKPFGMDRFLARLRAAVRRGAAASETRRAGDRNRFLHSRSGCEEGHQERRRGASDPTEWGMLEMLARNRGKAGRPRGAAQGGVGTGRMRRRPTICGCTWPSCGASSKTIRRTRVICSPRPGWATASRRDPGGCAGNRSGAHRFH